MNTKSFIAAAALALIGSTAFADPSPAQAPRSQLTRSEVQAELLRARAAGELDSAADSYGLKWAARTSTTSERAFARSRDEVREEAVNAARSRKHGDLNVGG